VSNDNAFAESLFRTCKYRPNYPSKPFGSIDETRQWTLSFVQWYNHRHKHSGLKFVTPAQRPETAASGAPDRHYAGLGVG
jgi:transposase InsO family protein